MPLLMTNAKNGRGDHERHEKAQNKRTFTQNPIRQEGELDSGKNFLFLLFSCFSWLEICFPG